MTSSFSRFRLVSPLPLAGFALAASAASVVAVLWGSAAAPLAVVAAAAGNAVIVLGLIAARSAEQRLLDKIATVCRRVGKGDFEARITHIGETGVRSDLQHAINAMIDSCDAFVRESAASLDAVSRGSFYRRILCQGLHGSFRAAAQTINAAVEACKSSDDARREAAARQAQMIRSLAEAHAHLARRDLTFRLHKLPEGYDQARIDFNNAMGALEETLQSVAASALAMNAGTQEIDGASSDLSRRAEQQASSLEETAAALDEITATVRKSAEGAERARRVVADANAYAGKSDEVVRKAVEAMAHIEESSQQIGQIIGVIDEIAFQTNLLALNAGVEAARAGEAGRGFAVVASEVRALALRSAQAAKEIKSLISTSTAQVGEGAELVAETGRSLGQIMAKVADINAVVSDIAAGAQEQATSLQHVNAAVNEMDKVTQQNAAMAERATATGRSLAQKAEQLTRLVGQFRMGNLIPFEAPRPAQAGPMRRQG